MAELRDDTPPGRRVPGVRLLVALFVAALALRPDVVGISPLLEPLQADLDVPRWVVGLLPTIPVVCMGLFAPLASWLASRAPIRRVILAGLATIALFGALRSASTSVTGLLLPTVGVGVGIALVQTLLPSVVRLHAAAAQGLSTGVYVAGIQLGAAGGAAVALPLAGVGGLRSPLLAFAGLAAVWALVWGLLGPRAHAVPVGAAAPASAVSRLRRPVVWLIIAAFGLQSMVFYGTNAWLAAWLMAAGRPDAHASQAVGLLNLGALAAALVVPAASDRWGSRRLALLASAAALTAGLVGLLVAPDLGRSWSVLAGVGLGPLLPLTLTLPLAVTRAAADVAPTSAAMLGVGYLAAAASPPLLGLLADGTASLRPVLLALLAGTAVFAAVAAALSEHRLAAAR